MEENVKSKKGVTEEKKRISPKKVNLILIVICLLLLFSLMPVLGILFFKYNMAGNYQKCNIYKQVVCNTQLTEEKEIEDPEIETKYIVPEVKNKGWALITAPDIKVSMEIPNDEIVSSKFQDKTLESTWSYSYRKTTEYDSKVFGTFKASLQADFFPLSIQDIVCGGNGCVNASHIYINGYYLGDNRTLEYVSEQFETLQTSEESSIVGKMSTKWNLPVYEYKLENPGGHLYGYIVVKDGYAYNITYYINSEPVVTVTTANRILDSITFN